jgi:ABC-type sugar transport system substrate-binding protein
MAYTYAPATDRGKVRLLVMDWTTESGPEQGTDYVFGDADIDAFLNLNDDDVWAAAADACRALAANNIAGALLIRLSGVDVDMKKIPAFWLAMADKYDRKSDDSDVVEYVDSIDHAVSFAGEDETEYVGDIT